MTSTVSIMQGVGARTGVPQRQAEELLGPGGAETLKASSGMLIGLSSVRSLHLGLWFLSRYALARHPDALQRKVHCHCVRSAPWLCIRLQLARRCIVSIPRLCAHCMQDAIQRIWREPRGANIHPDRADEASSIWSGHGWNGKNAPKGHGRGQVRLHSRSHHTQHMALSLSGCKVP